MSSNSNDMPLGCSIGLLVILAIVWVAYASIDMSSNGITEVMMEEFVNDKHPEYGILSFTDSGNDNIAQNYRDVTFVVDMSLRNPEEHPNLPAEFQVEVRCFDNGWASPHICRTYGGIE